MKRLEDDVDEKRTRRAELQNSLEAYAVSTRSFERARSLLASFESLYEKSAYGQKREILAALAASLGGLCVSSKGLSWTRRAAARR